MSEETTRDRLVTSAALLFRQKGYEGVGVAEILAAAGAPKGSLYHHFPNGKADLARAAAKWTSGQMLRIMDEAFDGKTAWKDGVAHYAAKLAKLFDILDHIGSCPLQAMLFDGPDDTMFREMSDGIYREWQDRLAGHAVRLGLTPERAETEAETLVIAIAGAWTLARSRRNSAVIRSIPARMFA